MRFLHCAAVLLFLFPRRLRYLHVTINMPSPSLDHVTLFRGKIPVVVSTRVGMYNKTFVRAFWLPVELPCDRTVVQLLALLPPD